MDVFISYSSNDVEKVKPICSGLKGYGVTYWAAFENSAFGESYIDTIMTELNAAKVILLFVSESSMASDHVKRELRSAADRKKHIIPIALSEVTLSYEFEYFLASSHFLPYDKSPDFCQKLAQRIVEIINTGNGSAPYSGAHIKPITKQANPKSKVKIGVILLSVFAVVAALIIGAVIYGIGVLSDLRKPVDTGIGSSAPQSSQSITVSSATDESSAEATASQPVTENPSTESQPVVKGENQIPEMYNEEVEAFKYQSGLALANATMYIDVGGGRAPDGATVWTNGVIYSGDTSIAAVDGKIIKGVSKGETYVVFAASKGSSIAHVYKVIVE